MDRKSFGNPPKAVRPMVRWWWPGLDVAEEELAREIDELDRAGIGGVELQPCAIGLPPDLAKRDPERAARVHRFMQPYHYQMIDRVVAEAARRGMFVDITQNSSWPTGGTHIRPEDSHKTLLFGVSTVHGPRHLSVRVPPVRPLRLYFFLGRIVPLLLGGGMSIMSYIPEDKKLVRVLAGKVAGRPGKLTSWKVKRSTPLEKDSMVDLTERVGPTGLLSWDVPEGTWQIFAAYEGSAGANALMDARSAPGLRSLVVDHFDRKAAVGHLEAFLGTVRDRIGSRFGTTVRAFFTDSFELVSPMHWKRGFLEEFRRRRGYDIAPYLPAMYVPLKDVGYWSYGNEVGLPNFDFAGDDGRRMRWDFQRTLSELFLSEFISPIAAWARENKLRSRVQGYGMMADPLAMLGLSDIPETEQLYGGGALNFLKLAGAAGALYEHPIVTAETLVWMGRSYMTTPLKWRVGIDRLYESGITQVIYHGYPYRAPSATFPGYHPFSALAMQFASDMSANDPLLAGAAPAINGYAARAQEILMRGRVSSRVGIFYQLFDYPNGNYVKEELVQGVLDDEDTQFPPARGPATIVMGREGALNGDRLWIRETVELASNLVARGHYPLYFNEDRLVGARVEGRAVRMGELGLEALVLYHENRLTLEAARALAEVARAGVPVFFVGCRPDEAQGYQDHEARDHAVRETMASIPGAVCRDGEELQAALIGAGVRPEVSYDEPQARVGFIHRVDRQDGTDYYFLRSRMREEQRVAVRLPGAGAVPVRLDLWSGRMATLPHTASGDGARIELGLAGYESVMIAMLPAAEATGLPPAEVPVMRDDLETVVELRGFRFSAELRLPDGSSRRVETALEWLTDWREIPGLAGLSNPGTYEVEVSLPAAEPGQRLFLDLARVCDRADVTVNGTELPALLVPPWRREVTGLLRAGSNVVRIVVTPTLRNCLVAYGNARVKGYRAYRRQATMAAGLIGAARVCRLRS